LRRRESDAVFDVLDADGHAGQRTRILAAGDASVDAVGLLARGGLIEHDEGVELRIFLCNGIQALLERIMR
jgi:hypothetical protein